MQGSDQLTVKLKIGRDFRRVTITKPKSHAELLASLESAFNILPENATALKFLDSEEDACTLSNDAEYQEALRCMDRILRLTLQGAERVPTRAPAGGRRFRNRRASPARASAEETTEPPAQEQQQQQQQEQQEPEQGPQDGEVPSTGIPALDHMLQNSGLRSMAESFLSQNSNLVTVLQPFLCDVCDAEIAGDRYHSTTADDYDLCAACFASNPAQNDVHKFAKITPLQAIASTLRGGGGMDAFFTRGPCGGGRCPARRAEPPQQQEDAEQRSTEQAVDESIKEAIRKSNENVKVEDDLYAEPKVEPPVLVETAAPPVPVAQEGAPEPRNAFAVNLQTLESMGFSNRQQCIQALVRNRNKLFETIQELLG